MPLAWSHSQVSCRSVTIDPIRPIHPIRRKQSGKRLDGYPFLAAVRTGIPEGTEPLVGGKRSATSGG